MEYNPQQLEALKKHDQNVLIAASAGSGKTFILVNRIVNFLYENKDDIDSVLVLTFTENAAAEMKSRVAKYLKMKLSDDEENNKYINKQLANLPGSYISTFHSFCLNVIKKYYPIVCLDLKTVNNILDTNSVNKLKRIALDNIFLEYKNDPRFFELFYQSSSSALGFDNVEKIIEEFSKKILESENQDEFVENLKRQYSFDNPQIASYLKDKIEIITKCLLEIKENSDYLKKRSRTESKLAILRDSIEIINSIYNKYDYQSFYEAMLNYFKIKDRSFNTEDLALGQTIRLLNITEKEILGWLKDTEELQSDFDKINKLISFIIELSLKFNEEFLSVKSKVGIDFNDMEYYCLKILENSDFDVANQLKKQFKNIYIDEFQDTNYLQDKVINLICRDSNIFRVGDIKQSIYGFRNAKPQLFLQYLKEDNQKVINLNVNYRSSANILNLVNIMFQKLFNIDGLDKIFEENDNVNYGGFIEFDGKPKLVLLSKKENVVEDELDEDGEVIEKSEDKKESFLATELKAHYIADEILRLKEQGVNYRDICILMRSRSHNKIIADIFESKNIPIKISIENSLATDSKVLALISAFNFLINSSNKINLTSVLKNFYEYSDDRLVDLFKVGSISLDALKIFDLETYNSLTSILSGYHRMGLIEIFNYWINLNDFMSNNITLVQRNNLMVFQDIIENFENNNYLGFVSFISYLSEFVENDENFDSVIYRPDEEVVIVETIHGSKGKEYPYVFLWGKSSFNLVDIKSNISISAEHGALVRCVSSDYRFVSNNIVSTIVTEKIKEAIVMEELRIFYVALTRAKYNFYYVDTFDTDNEIFYQPLSKNLVVGKAGYSRWLELLLGYRDVFESFEVIYPRNDFELGEGLKNSVDDKFTESYIPDDKLNSPSMNSEKNEILHLDWDSVKGLEIGSEIHNKISNHIINKTKPTDKYLLKLFENKLFEELLNHENQSEYTYYQLVNNQLIKGVIDFICFKDNEIVIVDFKTNKIDNNQQLIELYQKQIDTYCAIIKKEYKKNVIGYLYSFSLNEMIEVYNEKI